MTAFAEVFFGRRPLFHFFKGFQNLKMFEWVIFAWEFFREKAKAARWNDSASSDPTNAEEVNRRCAVGALHFPSSPYQLTADFTCSGPTWAPIMPCSLLLPESLHL